MGRLCPAARWILYHQSLAATPSKCALLLQEMSFWMSLGGLSQCCVMLPSWALSDSERSWALGWHRQCPNPLFWELPSPLALLQPPQVPAILSSLSGGPWLCPHSTKPRGSQCTSVSWHALPKERFRRSRWIFFFLSAGSRFQAGYFYLFLALLIVVRPTINADRDIRFVCPPEVATSYSPCCFPSTASIK